MRAGADPYFLGDFAFEHLSHTLDRRIWLGPSFQLIGIFGSREISWDCLEIGGARAEGGILGPVFPGEVEATWPGS